MKQLARQAYRGALSALPARLVVQISSLRTFGRIANLSAPVRFSDKVHCRKLFDRNAHWPLLVDKLRVKDYVAGVLGTRWVVPTLWSGATISSAEVQGLPCCVIKANHGSGTNLFYEPGMDTSEVARKANSWIEQDYGRINKEWAYTAVPRRLLAEELIADDPPDFKFFVFAGTVHMIQVDAGRFTRHTRNFYSPEWTPIDLELTYRRGPFVQAPPHLAEMLEAAGALGRGIDFARIDFYDVPAGPKFGEITLYPGAGLERFVPDSYEYVLGRLWKQADAQTFYQPPSYE